MKKINLLLILMFCFLLSAAYPSEQAEDAIITLAEIAEENGLPIEGWEVTLKETLHTSNFNYLVNKAENSHLVSRREDENSIKYELVKKDKTSYFDMEKHMYVSKNNPGQVELIAVLSGTEWNGNIRGAYEEMRQELDADFFQHQAVSFACLHVLDGGTIGDRMVIDVYAESLDLVHIEEQRDLLEISKHKKMIYGYTPLWDDKFVIEGIPYNFQMAAAPTETGATAYTIGTPILVNEY